MKGKHGRSVGGTGSVLVPAWFHLLFIISCNKQKLVVCDINLYNDSLRLITVVCQCTVPFTSH